MSTEGNPITRFDPTLGISDQDFVTSQTTVDAKRRAIFLTLNAAFTPACESIMTQGLILPESTRNIDPFLMVRVQDRYGSDYFRVNQSAVEDITYSEPNDQTIPMAGEITNEFTFRKHRYLLQSKDGSGTVIPVGQTGQDTAIALMRAVNTLDTVSPDLLHGSWSLAGRFDYSIENGTHFKNMRKTVADSFKSMAEAFAFLTNSSTFPEYSNDPVGLFKRLIESGAFNQLASVLLMADLARLNADGISLENAIDPVTFTLNRDFMRAMRERQRKAREAGIGTKWLHITSYGCPVSLGNTPTVDADGNKRIIPETGINMAARVFVMYFEHHYNELISEEGNEQNDD